MPLIENPITGERTLWDSAVIPKGWHKVNGILDGEDNLKIEKIPDKLSVGKYYVDRIFLCIRKKNGRKVHLPWLSFKIFHYLAIRQGHEVTRKEIMELWPPNVVVDKRTIDVHVHRIREVVGDEYVETVNAGYKIPAMI